MKQRILSLAPLALTALAVLAFTPAPARAEIVAKVIYINKTTEKETGYTIQFSDRRGACRGLGQREALNIQPNGRVIYGCWSFYQGEGIKYTAIPSPSSGPGISTADFIFLWDKIHIDDAAWDRFAIKLNDEWLATTLPKPKK